MSAESEDRRVGELSEGERDRLHQKLDDLRDMLRDHIAEEKDIAPALRELVALWRASKVIGVFLTMSAAVVSAAWAAAVWVKEHIKL